MSSDLTAEQAEIQALARSFAEGEIRPRAAEWDARRVLDGEVFASLAELGFLGMRVPEEHGGLGFDFLTYLLVLEELAWGDAAVALSVAVQNGPVASVLVDRGSEAQKEEILPGLASGETLGAFALSEPGAGSDAGAVETRARREDGGWRLTGTKRWVTNGDRADEVLVFARTREDAERGGGIGAFLVNRRSEGYRVGRRERTMGLRASETVEVHLEEVRVEEDRVVGDPEGGYGYALAALDVGRVGIAAQCVGIARAAWEHAVGYAREREQFGRSIASFGAIQEKLADMAVRIDASRGLAHRAARALDVRVGRGRDRGPDGPVARAAKAKLLASETAVNVADEAIQIFGGYGYMRDYPVEKLLRDAKGTEIYEGTSEILRRVIARAILEE